MMLRHIYILSFDSSAIGLVLLITLHLSSVVLLDASPMQRTSALIARRSINAPILHLTNAPMLHRANVKLGYLVITSSQHHTIKPSHHRASRHCTIAPPRHRVREQPRKCDNAQLSPAPMPSAQMCDAHMHLARKRTVRASAAQLRHRATAPSPHLANSPLRECTNVPTCDSILRVCRLRISVL